MERMTTTQSGRVSVKADAKMRKSRNYEAIQYLEDGLSYLNYAKSGSCHGHGDPEADYRTGMGFLMSALDALTHDKNL